MAATGKRGDEHIVLSNKTQKPKKTNTQPLRAKAKNLQTLIVDLFKSHI